MKCYDSKFSHKCNISVKRSLRNTTNHLYTHNCVLLKREKNNKKQTNKIPSKEFPVRQWSGIITPIQGFTQQSTETTHL